MARQRGYCFREVMLFTALVSVECTNVVMNTLYKAAVAKGLSFHVYMAYGYAISSLILLPLAFIFHRWRRWCSFSGQYVGNLGIKYSNPTMASAMNNIAPACTFFLAIIFRMKKLKLTSISSQAKVMGALVSIAGALVVVLYNGPLLISDTSQSSSAPSIVLVDTLSNARSNWIVRGALNAVCYAIASIWYIFQGLMGSGYAIMIHTWGLHEKGPVYVALFRPLSIAIAAILGVIFLGDDLYLGTVIGSVVITMGFYTV